MTPVMLLTDGYIANAAEPWKVPDMAAYEPFPVAFHDEPPAEGRGRSIPMPATASSPGSGSGPARPGLMHRIGGIEKNVGTGHIDYAPANHQAMTDIRANKVLGSRRQHRPTRKSASARQGGKLAVVGWGSTFGPIHQAVRRARGRGLDVSHIHIRHIWPLPKNLGDLLGSYERIIVPEMNKGQFKTLLRDQYLVDARPVTKVSGQPFKIAEIEAAIDGGAGMTARSNASRTIRPELSNACFPSGLPLIMRGRHHLASNCRSAACVQRLR